MIIYNAPQSECMDLKPGIYPVLFPLRSVGSNLGVMYSGHSLSDAIERKLLHYRLTPDHFSLVLSVAYRQRRVVLRDERRDGCHTTTKVVDGGRYTTTEVYDLRQAEGFIHRTAVPKCYFLGWWPKGFRFRLGHMQEDEGYTIERYGTHTFAYWDMWGVQNICDNIMYNLKENSLAQEWAVLKDNSTPVTKTFSALMAESFAEASKDAGYYGVRGPCLSRAATETVAKTKEPVTMHMLFERTRKVLDAHPNLTDNDRLFCSEATVADAWRRIPVFNKTYTPLQLINIANGSNEDLSKLQKLLPDITLKEIREAARGHHDPTTTVTDSFGKELVLVGTLRVSLKTQDAVAARLHKYNVSANFIR